MRLPDTAVHCTFSAEHPPAAVIPSGGTICLETRDCFSNRLRDGVWRRVPRTEENPATGPVFVEGAHPGSMLRVEILEIRLADFGVVEHGRDSGCLGSHIRENRVRLVPLREGRAWITETLSVPLRPMVGVLGTAPAEGAPMTMLPGPHGGNLDCTRITAGSTVCLPVSVEGALVSAGDLHAAMGDGEVGVTGLEIPGAVTLRLTAEDHWYASCPVVCCENRVYALSSAKTLDQACRDAAEQLHRLLVTLAGLDPEDAAALLTLAGDLSVCQICNPLVTAAMSVPGEYLPGLARAALPGEG